MDIDDNILIAHDGLSTFLKTHCKKGDIIVNVVLERLMIDWIGNLVNNVLLI